MEGKTPTEKIHSLSELVVGLTERVKVLDANATAMMAENSQTTQDLGELKTMVVRIQEQMAELQRWKEEMASVRNMEIEIAVLKRLVEKLEKVKEEWGRRIWAVVPPVVAAILGVILGYFLRR